MRRSIRFLLASVLTIGIAGLPMLRPAAQPATPAAPAPEVVELAEVVRTDFAPLHWAPGSVLSRHDARLSSEQGGKVVQIVEVGESVRSGQLLAQVDDASLRLRASEEQVRLARIEAQRDLSRSQLERFERMAERGALSQSQIDQLRGELSMLSHEAKGARLALEQIQLRIAQHQLRAPFDGIVAERHAQRGEFVSIGAPLLRLVDTSAIELQVRAPVALAERLAVGIEVQLEGENAPSHGRIASVVPVGDDSSRQLELRIALNGSSLPVGAALRAGLPSAVPRSVLAVPRDAILLRREGSRVMRVGSDAIAEQVVVDIGAQLGDLVEVHAELAPGDRLVIRGAERLQPGQRVHVPDRAAAVASVP